jgi:ribosomal protein S18 acetylase RimI-like enzyme
MTQVSDAHASGAAGRAVPPEVRLARPDEWDAVADVTYLGFGHGVPGARQPSASRLAELRDTAGRAREGDLLVAVSPVTGKIVGTASLLRPGACYNRQALADEAELRLLAVLPEARRQGAGRSLMEEAVRRARDWGVPALVLDTGPRNVASQSLYRSLGFLRAVERETKPAFSGGLLVVFRYAFEGEKLA